MYKSSNSLIITTVHWKLSQHLFISHTGHVGVRQAEIRSNFETDFSIGLRPAEINLELDDEADLVIAGFIAIKEALLSGSNINDARTKTHLF